MTWYYWLSLILGLGVFGSLMGGHIQRLQEVERKLNLLLEHAGLDPLAPVEPSQTVKDLALDPSRKIEAIRQYRKETGAGLKDAAKVIEAVLTRRDAGSA